MKYGVRSVLRSIGAARTGVLQHARLTWVKTPAIGPASMRRYNEIPYVPCRGSDYCFTMRDDMTVFASIDSMTASGGAMPNITGN